MTKILVVDDNEQNRYMLQVLLQGHNYHVTLAENGKDALEIVQHTLPDMIISDILMPEMDGFTLCRRWMEQERLKKIPFVFYTATYTDSKDIELGNSLGAARFIIKPTEPDIFIAEIQSVLCEYETGKLALDKEPAAQESVYLKEYNQVLIHKLEEKMTQLERANKRLSMLYQVSINLASIRSLDKLVAHTLRIVIDATGYSHANYFTFDEEMQQFHLLEAVGHPEEKIALFRSKLVFSLGETRGLVGLVGKTGKPLILPDTHADPRWIILDEKIRSALFTPVFFETELLGVATFLSTETNAFNDEDVNNVMTLANSIAIAINNARLYEKQQQYALTLEDEVAHRTNELKLALEQAQAADRLKSQFVSDVNHELRTPLSNIKLYLNLLEWGRQENRTRYMEILNRETGRLEKLIEDLLDLSQLDAGKLTANLVPSDLNQLLATLIIDRSDLVIDHGLTLDFEPDAELPLALIDYQLLFQVFTNLLVNAMNYTPANGA
ncbi:MAG: response regulator, partial [Anaerolineales bacterium]|nr:response regulator [Anaerolineales bacterium]